MTQASCALKHMLAWSMVARSNRNITTILEDDMIPGNGFHSQLQRTLRSLPRGWDIFNFGCPGSKLVRPGAAYCSRGYSLTRSGARKMLRRDRVVDTCDGMVSVASKSANAYHASLPVTHGSSIRGRPLPRGADICQRAHINVSKVRAQAARFYAHSNAFFRESGAATHEHQPHHAGGRPARRRGLRVSPSRLQARRGF